MRIARIFARGGNLFYAEHSYPVNAIEKSPRKNGISTYESDRSTESSPTVSNSQGSREILPQHRCAAFDRNTAVTSSAAMLRQDRKSTRLNSSHGYISY